MSEKKSVALILVRAIKKLSCKNGVSFLLLLITFSEIKAQDKHPDLNYRAFCFYYNWYGNPQNDGQYLHWAHPVLKKNASDTSSGYFEGGKNIGANYYPQLGTYSNSDKRIIAQHMRMLQQAGIGVIVVTWWNKGDFMDKTVPLILDEAAKKKIKVCFHIEPFPGRNAATTKSAIEYLVDTYGKHPAFFRSSQHANKPFFFVYDSYLTNASDWASLLRSDGNKSIRNTLYDAVVLGLWVKKDDASFFEHSGFDGFYTYFASEGFTYGSTTKNWNYLQQWATSHQQIFVPCVGPGYIDTRIRPWNDKNTRNRLEGQYYDKMFQAAINLHPSYIGITSFNEWHEGTQIEPAVPFKTRSFSYENYLPLRPDYYLNRTRYWLGVYRKNN